MSNPYDQEAVIERDPAVTSEEENQSEPQGSFPLDDAEAGQQMDDVAADETSTDDTSAEATEDLGHEPDSDKPGSDNENVPADQSPTLPVLVEQLAGLNSEIAELRGAFENRIAAYEQQARTMHSSMEELRQQQLTSLMKPTFQQFADLHSELAAAAQRADDADDHSYAEDFRYFEQLVETMMERFDLESVGATAGAPFERRSHAAVLTKRTKDAEEDQTIARVVRQGFRVSGEERVLIPARVVIWKYEPEKSGNQTPPDDVEANEPVQTPPAEA